MKKWAVIPLAIRYFCCVSTARQPFCFVITLFDTWLDEKLSCHLSGYQIFLSRKAHWWILHRKAWVMLTRGSSSFFHYKWYTRGLKTFNFTYIISTHFCNWYRLLLSMVHSKGRYLEICSKKYSLIKDARKIIYNMFKMFVEFESTYKTNLNGQYKWVY